MYNRIVGDLRYRENRRLVNDLISVSNRFKEYLRYRENRRLVNDLFPAC